MSISQLQKSIIMIRLNIKLPDHIKKQNTNILFKWFIDNNKLVINSKNHQSYFTKIMVTNNIKINIQFDLDLIIEPNENNNFYNEEQILQHIITNVYINEKRMDIKEQLFFEDELEEYIIIHYSKRTNKWIEKSLLYL